MRLAASVSLVAEIGSLQSKAEGKQGRIPRKCLLELCLVAGRFSSHLFCMESALRVQGRRSTVQGPRTGQEGQRQQGGNGANDGARHGGTVLAGCPALFAPTCPPLTALGVFFAGSRRVRVAWYVPRGGALLVLALVESRCGPVAVARSLTGCLPGKGTPDRRGLITCYVLVEEAAWLRESCALGA